MLYTEEQKKIITSSDKHLVVVANAGTGKTTTIIEKIKYLLDNKLTEASNIMLTSFSRVAASELYEKAVKSVGLFAANSMQIGTIHSVCYKIIMENLKILNIKNIDIKSEAYLIAVVYNRHNNIYSTKKEIAKDVAKYRKYLFDKEYPKEVGDDRFNAIHDCQQILEAEGKFLYDDLLLKTIELFTKHPEIRREWQNKFEWIITDESQDNSKPQWEIIELLINDKTNTVVIGDAKQNIYQFRGCSYLFLEDYRKKMKAKVLPLTQTFRFGQPFADISNKVIDNLELDETYKKHTITKVERNSKPEFKRLQSIEQPNDVVERVKEFIEAGCPYKDMNVVYRYNKEAIPFMKAFIKNKIPFAVKTGDVFERQEIQFVINALKLMKNFTINDCNILFSMYSDFIGDKTLTTIYKEIKHDNMTVLSFLDEALKSDIQGIGHVKRRSLTSMKNRLTSLNNYLHTKENHIPTIAGILDMDETKFMLKEAENVRSGNPSEDREEFLMFFQDCFKDSQKEDILEWYNDTILNGHRIKEKDSNSIALKTIHGCKGQTLPIVFFIVDGIADKRFYREDVDIEPEKFVLYVGLTRAEKNMIIYVANPVEFRFKFIFPEDWQKQIEMLKQNGENPLEETKSPEPKISSVVGKSDKRLKENVMIKHTTEKAVMFALGSKTFWIPIQFVSSKEGRYYLTNWVVSKNNLNMYVE